MKIDYSCVTKWCLTVLLVLMNSVFVRAQGVTVTPAHINLSLSHSVIGVGTTTSVLATVIGSDNNPMTHYPGGVNPIEITLTMAGRLPVTVSAGQTHTIQTGAITANPPVVAQAALTEGDYTITAAQNVKEGDTKMQNAAVTLKLLKVSFSASRFVPLNDDWDEENRNAAGVKVADNAVGTAGDRIVATDTDIRTATLHIAGGATTGKWKLTIPAGLKVWKEDIGGAFTEITSDAQSEQVTAPYALTVHLEGVALSAAFDDAILKASFTPSPVATVAQPEITSQETVKTNEAKTTVVKVNLSSDVSELDEDTPGAWVHFNLDDDNLSDVDYVVSARPGADFEEVTDAVVNENDLKSLSVSFGGALGTLPTEGKITLQTAAGIKLWESAKKGAANLVLGAGASKTWDLSITDERTNFSGIQNNLHVEGVAANVASSVEVSYQRQVGTVWTAVASDKVKYDSIASDVGVQPKAKSTNIFFTRNNATTTGYFVDAFTDPNQRDRWHNGSTGIKTVYGKDIKTTGWPNLKDCEFSITDNRWTQQYNCIAESVGENAKWYDDQSSEGTNVIGISEVYGGLPAHAFNVTDMDKFYLAKKNWTPTATGAADAQTMYYPNFHAARRTSASASGLNRWIMYQSKVGATERIEHVWDQLNGGIYGTPNRFYK